MVGVLSIFDDPGGASPLDDLMERLAVYLCYIDETGTRDPRLKIPQKNGTEKEGDFLYVLTALCIFERGWHTMEKRINRHKMALMERI